MFYNILVNPIVFGIFAAVIAYLYLYWDSEQKYKKNPNRPRQSVNLMIPFVIGIVVWFLAYGYFESNMTSYVDNTQQLPIIEDNLSSPIGAKSYHLTSRGITIPSKLSSKLPPVLIETYS